jgi:23S rRNA (pseudouridine1915-N3)-methyltransferase
MSVKIICLGKTKQIWIKQGIEEYQKRLNPYWKILWQELKDVSLKDAGSVLKVKQQEATILAKALSDTDFVIALDERGRSFDSEAFTKELTTLMMSKDIVFVIGGVYGLDSTILDRANFKLSFSAFTFPHQLIRLILMEQLYRCWTISSNKSYHY